MAWGTDSRQVDGATVSLVRCAAGTVHVALDARLVLAMGQCTDTPRRASLASLLGVSSPPPSHWLTLRDAQGRWQLGVNGDVTLETFPAHRLHKLPEVVAPRRHHPSLCGITLTTTQLVLLIDAQALSP